MAPRLGGCFGCIFRSRTGIKWGSAKVISHLEFMPTRRALKPKCRRPMRSLRAPSSGRNSRTKARTLIRRRSRSTSPLSIVPDGTHSPPESQQTSTPRRPVRRGVERIRLDMVGPAKASCRRSVQTFPASCAAFRVRLAHKCRDGRRAGSESGPASDEVRGRRRHQSAGFQITANVSSPSPGARPRLA